MIEDKRRYDVGQIKKRVNSILNGTCSVFGDYLDYGSKKTAEKIVEKLRIEGVNCHIRKSKYRRRGCDIVFNDITKMMKSNIAGKETLKTIQIGYELEKSL